MRILFGKQLQFTQVFSQQHLRTNPSHFSTQIYTKIILSHAHAIHSEKAEHLCQRFFLIPSKIADPCSDSQKAHPCTYPHGFEYRVHERHSRDPIQLYQYTCNSSRRGPWHPDLSVCCTPNDAASKKPQLRQTVPVASDAACKFGIIGAVLAAVNAANDATTGICAPELNLDWDRKIHVTVVGNLMGGVLTSV